METAGYYLMGRLLGNETLSLNAIVVNHITEKFYSEPNKVIEKPAAHTLAKV